MSDLVLVVGVGRSGTSLVSGILGQLGYHIPQPEVQADETNPKGFGEPRWVVDFHTRLLRQRRVGVNDARPAAWELTRTATGDESVRSELRQWLKQQAEQGSGVVVKDPRTGWFLPLWLSCASELGINTRFLTMLRHPAEIVTSALRSYGDTLTPATRTGAWMNGMLETEHATRGDRRVFVRYEDLLADWSSQVRRIGELLDLPDLTKVTPETHPDADAFVDPGLHRARVRWDDLDVPAAVRDMAEDVWERFQPLADPGGDSEQAHVRLDEAHAAYRRLYADAEALAQSSIVAARKRRKQPAAPASLRVRIARTIPPRYRRRLRRVLRRKP